MKKANSTNGKKRGQEPSLSLKEIKKMIQSSFNPKERTLLASLRFKKGFTKLTKSELMQLASDPSFYSQAFEKIIVRLNQLRGKFLVQRVTFPQFVKVLSDEYKKWIASKSPYENIAPIPVMRENVCSILSIHPDQFDMALLKLKDINVSLIPDERVPGKPIRTEAGYTFSKLMLYDKPIPSDLIKSVLPSR